MAVKKGTFNEDEEKRKALQKLVKDTFGDIRLNFLAQHGFDYREFSPEALEEMLLEEKKSASSSKFKNYMDDTWIEMPLLGRAKEATGLYMSSEPDSIVSPNRAERRKLKEKNKTRSREEEEEQR